MNKGGAPKGNRNRMTHGIRGFLVNGSLPKGASYIKRQANAYRDALDASVAEHHGHVSIYHAGLVQACVIHFTRALLLLRYLRKLGPETSENLSERLTILRDLSAAVGARDKSAKELGIDHIVRQDVWALAAIDTTTGPATTPAAPDPQQAGDASRATELPQPPASDDAATVDQLDFLG